MSGFSAHDDTKNIQFILTQVKKIKPNPKITTTNLVRNKGMRCILFERDGRRSEAEFTIWPAKNKLLTLRRNVSFLANKIKNTFQHGAVHFSILTVSRQYVCSFFQHPLKQIRSSHTARGRRTSDTRRQQGNISGQEAHQFFQRDTRQNREITCFVLLTS